MRTFLLLVAATVTVGCSSSAGFDLRKESCDADVTALSRGLTHHIVSGDGSGAFDYVPDGNSRVRIDGSYDLASGDFAWTETGSATSYVDRVAVTGFGYANENGDLDIIGTRSETDVNGAVEETQFRTERTGCAVRTRVRSTVDGVERERDERGTFADGRYDYSSTVGIDGYAYSTDGTRFLDGSYNETVSYESPDFERNAERSGNLFDDTQTLQYDDVIQTQSLGTMLQVGTDITSTDGSVERTFTRDYADRFEEWSYALDYNGNGSGQVTVNGSTVCSLTYTAFQCRYDCGSSGRGEC